MSDGDGAAGNGNREVAVLERTLANLEALFNNSLQAFVLLDCEGRIRTCNPVARAWLERLMQQPGPLEGAQLDRVVFPTGETPYQSKLQRVLDGETIVFERDLPLPGGAVVWFEISYSPVATEAGETIGILLSGVNITARKQAEQALQRSEQRLEFALEGTALGIWDWDFVADRVVVNARTAALFGYGATELSGREWRSRLHPEDEPVAAERLQSHLQGRCAAYESEHRVRTQDAWRWVSERGKVVARDEAGRPLRAAGTALDVTEPRRVADESARLAAELQDQRKLESIGRLAGGVAHDFNNLLTAMLCCSEMVLEQLEPTSAAHQHVQEIREAGRRAADLTRQLLAFSRQQLLSVRAIDLNRVVHDTATMLRRLIEEHVQIQLDLQEDLCPVRADQTQLEQILMNLALNARDAMPKGGQLVIRTSAVEFSEEAEVEGTLAPGRYALLVLSDTGMGMDAETRARIFEPFFTTKRLGKGTGLGLATVYGLVQQHHGHIRVESRLGEGTTFRVYWPMATDEDAPRAQAAHPPQTVGGRERVLVVEDERMVRGLVSKLLRAQGYEVHEATDGLAALTLVQQLAQPIHLLLTDVVMPSMNGDVLYGHLREQQPDLRVLYMSGYTDRVSAVEDVVTSGGVLLEKPFTIQALLARVREVLDAAD